MLSAVPHLDVDLATTLLGQAGGGSSGFSGGGGGGGGGSSSGGGSGGSGGGGPWWSWLIIALLVMWSSPLMAKIARRRRARATQQREQAISGALLEAGEEDAAFQAEEVRETAASLVERTQRAWDERDIATLERLVGPDLLVEWRHRLADFEGKGWHSRIVLKERPTIRLVGLVNREDDEDDRVTVHVTVATETWVAAPGDREYYRDGADDRDYLLSQFWTLGRRDEAWILLSIEEDGEGDHHLRSEVVATPDADHAIADRARTELATEDAASDVATVAEIVPRLTEDARATAMDLALADDRFSPDVLAAAVRRAVAAWTEAVDGDDRALESVSTPQTVDRLLYADAGKDVRTVVRGPRVQDVLIDRVDGTTRPPRVEVAVRHRARWYREDRVTQAVFEGSREREVTRMEHWTFALQDDADVVWRLVDV